MSRRDREDDLLTRVGIAIEEGDDGADEAAAGMLAEEGTLLQECLGAVSDLLERAVGQGLIETTKALLEIGADPNWFTENGVAPLMGAAWGGHLEIARLLLDAGADPNVMAGNDKTASDPTWFGRYPLYFALVKGRQNLVELLEPLTSPEAREQAVRAARKALEREAAKPPPEPPEFQELFRAIVADDPAAVSAALAAGADVNGRNNQGTSPLWLAAAGCRVRALPVLLAHGAEVDAPGEKVGEELGTTPLTTAVRLKRFAVLAPLLAAGADPDRPDGRGMTAWQMARIGQGDDSRLEALRHACEEVRRGERPPRA